YAYNKTGNNGTTDIRAAAGWLDYQMDGDGNLAIQSDAKNMAYLAYGKKSGEVHLFTLKKSDGTLWDWFGPNAHVCPGAPAPRLEAGKNAVVTAADGVQARDNPGSGGHVVTTFANGTALQVQDGPQCKGGVYWWNASDNQNSGWVPESGGGGYLLKPSQ
ncbi:MAG TPA: hypothetical protein VF832_19515, partial [Longimicrobiales bacterium]